jgi:hypothetical protein
MPSIRIGLSTDFNLTNELVGINTTVPSVRLDVRGQILSQNTAGGSGISTLTTYDGFLDAQQRVISNITISQTTKGNLNSLSGEIVVDNEVTVTGNTPLTGGRLDSLTVTSNFDLPHGGTEDREDTPEKGSTRFNQDLGQLEFYTGTEWRTTASYDGSGRGRGVFGGTYSTIEYINISSTGNAINFGTLSVGRTQLQSCSSSIRGLFAGGYVSPGTFYNVIDYITIASEGNAIDFGDLNISARRKSGGGCSSSTRGIFAGGFTGTPTSTSFNNIDYVTIATIGNALDFGDLSITRSFVGALSSPTRAVFAGGFSQPSPALTGWNIIEYVTISSTGNAVDFGDLLNLTYGKSGVSNGTRGVYVGGEVPGPILYLNTIEHITIATTGNSTYFGDLTLGRTYSASTCSLTRGVFGGGTTNPSSPTTTNVMDYITITTAGNAQDFGDLTRSTTTTTGLSDSHGGLGGF